MEFPTILPTKVVTAYHKALQADAPRKVWLFQPWLRLELYQRSRAIFFCQVQSFQSFLIQTFSLFWVRPLNLLSVSHNSKAVQ